MIFTTLDRSIVIQTHLDSHHSYRQSIVVIELQDSRLTSGRSLYQLFLYSYMLSVKQDCESYIQDSDMFSLVMSTDSQFPS